MSRGKPKPVFCVLVLCFFTILLPLYTLLPNEVKREIQFHFSNRGIYFLSITLNDNNIY